MISKNQWSWFHLLASQRNTQSLNETLKGVLATLGQHRSFFFFTPKYLVADQLFPEDLSLAFSHGQNSTPPELSHCLSHLSLENPIYQLDEWTLFLTHQLLRPLSLCIIENKKDLEIPLIHAILELHSQMHLLLSKYPIDPLTGLYNREYFERWVRRIYERNLFATMRTLKDSQWCLALFDLDHFADINRQYGSLKGDQILAEIGKQIANAFRPDDGLFRYAGDRFAILLRESNLETAFQVMDRFRQKIASHEFPVKTTITASIGMTQLDDRLWVTVIGDAKEALEQSKADGGNKLHIYEHLLTSGFIEEKSDWYGLEWLD